MDDISKSCFVWVLFSGNSRHNAALLYSGDIKSASLRIGFAESLSFYVHLQIFACIHFYFEADLFVRFTSSARFRGFSLTDFPFREPQPASVFWFYHDSLSFLSVENYDSMDRHSKIIFLNQLVQVLPCELRELRAWDYFQNFVAKLDNFLAFIFAIYDCI